MTEMATHSSVLAWRIPWTEYPGRLGSQESDTMMGVINKKKRWTGGVRQGRIGIAHLLLLLFFLFFFGCSVSACWTFYNFSSILLFSNY